MNTITTVKSAVLTFLVTATVILSISQLLSVSKEMCIVVLSLSIGLIAVIVFTASYIVFDKEAIEKNEKRIKNFHQTNSTTRECPTKKLRQRDGRGRYISTKADPDEGDGYIR